MRDAEAVTFAGDALDRATNLRAEAAGLLDAPGARCLPFWRGKPLFEVASGMGLGWVGTRHPVFTNEPGPGIFLGMHEGAPRFARDLAGWAGPVGAAAGAGGFLDDSRAVHPALGERFAFADLRAVMGALDAADAGVAATAKGVFAWHETHGFCARCGAASEVADAGWKRVCPACGGQHFPRTDPVVIMLILSGDDVLLGRSPAWPEGMYSLLAGFMEPGESIEAAVRRETWEETGVEIGAVDYLASQPWPFPSSLMIGCRGLARTREITLDPVELEDARWVGRQGVLDGLMGRDPAMRPARKGSIARFLIERWLADRLG
jgi:NAD+ diphosphatase